MRLNIPLDRIRHCIYGDCRIRIDNKKFRIIKRTILVNSTQEQLNLRTGLRDCEVVVTKTGDYFEINWYPTSLQESEAVITILDNLNEFERGVCYQDLKGNRMCFTYSGAHHTKIRSIYHNNRGKKGTSLTGTVAVPSPEDLNTLLNDLNSKEEEISVTSLGKTWIWKREEKPIGGLFQIICSNSGKATTWKYIASAFGNGSILCPEGNRINMIK